MESVGEAQARVRWVSTGVCMLCFAHKGNKWEQAHQLARHMAPRAHLLHAHFKLGLARHVQQAAEALDLRAQRTRRNARGAGAHACGEEHARVGTSTRAGGGARAREEEHSARRSAQIASSRCRVRGLKPRYRARSAWATRTSLACARAAFSSVAVCDRAAPSSVSNRWQLASACGGARGAKGGSVRQGVGGEGSERWHVQQGAEGGGMRVHRGVCLALAQGRKQRLLLHTGSRAAARAHNKHTPSH